jgi:hypothetical protein
MRTPCSLGVKTPCCLEAAPLCGFEIRLAEPISPAWSEWFSELEILPVEDEHGPATLLRGELPDQAALFGVLARIRNLNLTLLEVRRIHK